MECIGYAPTVDAVLRPWCRFNYGREGGISDICRCPEVRLSLEVPK
jgi:hypothetical protein